MSASVAAGRLPSRRWTLPRSHPRSCRDCGNSLAETPMAAASRRAWRGREKTVFLDQTGQRRSLLLPVPEQFVERLCRFIVAPDGMWAPSCAPPFSITQTPDLAVPLHRQLLESDRPASLAGPPPTISRSNSIDLRCIAYQ